MTKEDKTIQLILDESKKIQDVLNNDLLNRFAEMHNIPKEYNKFYAKQEIVAKNVYFLSVKKKYALWIVNNEGVPCKELMLKGLVTRRSDYPSITRERISTVLDFLLKEDKVSFKKIKKFVKDTENEIHELILNGSKIIAKPVSFTKDPKSYKKIPEQILGMKLWNSLEYNHFVVGSKGYRFKINGVDTFRAPDKVKKNISLLKNVKWIVLPYEEERLPEYYNIDVVGMLDYAWRKRVQELFEPIMHKVDKNSRIEKLSIATF